MRAWSLTALRLVMGFGFMAQSIPLILSMIGAMLTVQLRYGFSSINTIGLTPDGPVFGPPGYEINLLYIAGLLALALGGPDALSVDRWRAQRHGRSAVRG
jgi:putative oxidoreductase